MGFINLGLNYDSIRKLNSVKKLIGPDATSPNSIKTVFQPVPYNVEIELFLWSKTMTDGLQILEQIVPFFRPSFTVSMVELTDPQITRDVLITLNTITHDDNAEGLFDSTRMLEWIFSFTIEANLYGPVTDSGLITTVYVNTHIMDGEHVVKLTGTPDPSDAHAEDEWTFNEVWETFPELE